MSERTSENISPISDQPTNEQNRSTGLNTVEGYASEVIDFILSKNPDLTVLITNALNGKVLATTILSKTQACEDASNVLTFTDKCKVLVRKILNEDLEYVRIKGINNEIVVTFDEKQLEIITIQEDKDRGK